MIHTGPVVGTAYEPGIGLCHVEPLARGTFMLIPHNPAHGAVIRRREKIRWRRRPAPVAH